MTLPFRTTPQPSHYSQSLEGVRRLYVAPSYGSDSHDGLTPSTPFATMARAFERVESGDFISFHGKVREQLTTPVGIFDVTVMGMANRARHADNHSEPGGGSNAATWAAPASAVAETALCRVIQQGWRFENILWACPADWGGLEFVRNAGSGDAERDASHGHVKSCRFAGGLHHLVFGSAAHTENLFNIRVEDCDFNDATDVSWHVAGGGTYRFQVLDNRFMANESHIDAPLVQSFVKGNVFGLFDTIGMDLTGGSDNVVTGNYLTGDYTTAAYVAGDDDSWFGNFATDVAEDEVGADGLVTAVPAA